MTILIVPVSGGKDSQVCLSMAVNSGLKVLAVHEYTGFDHSATYEHLSYMEKLYGVKIAFTESKYKDMFGLIRELNYFPNRNVRACTSRLKQKPFNDYLNSLPVDDYLVMLGIRADESVQRKIRYGDISPSDVFTMSDLGNVFTKKAKDYKFTLPIVHWTTADVFKYLSDRGEKVNPLYAFGHKRVGCYPCLLSSKTEFNLVSKNEEGRANIAKLLELEKELMATGESDNKKAHPKFDLTSLIDDANSGCSYCQG